MKAVKHNILLKGYFKKKARAAENKKEDAENKKAEEKKK
jgi:phospholipid/cholesterol/gamma-HCH transport system substrate-binding protein